jgi:hypothetical protein
LKAWHGMRAALLHRQCPLANRYVSTPQSAAQSLESLMADFGQVFVLRISSYLSDWIKARLQLTLVPENQAFYNDETLQCRTFPF